MKTGLTFKVTSRFLTIVCIATIAAMTAGCQTMMDAAMRSLLGHNSEAPNISSIASYPTNDPELKIYLSYLGALENDLQGIRGEVMGAEEHEAQLKKAEVALRKAFDKSPIGSAEENFANTEKWVEDQRKMGPPNYLTLLPVGADPKDSGARIFKKAVMGNEDIENRSTSISVLYKFGSVEKMAGKANEIVNKLRPVFATQQGWKFQDPAFLKNQMNQSISLVEGNKDMNPEAKRKAVKYYEESNERNDAGQAMIQYYWDSDYRSQMGTTSVPAINLMMIYITPNLEPENDNYYLSVAFFRSINQPRNK